MRQRHSAESRFDSAFSENALASVVRKFDIVAVQEVKDSSGQVPNIFLAEINKTGRQYDKRVSSRTGRQPDDRNSQEQYAFFFDTDRISVVQEGGLFDDRRHDLFQREPFTVRFGVKGTPFTLTFTTIHTRPESAVAEIDALYTVYGDLKKRFPAEDRHLILGNFNAGCSYAKPVELAGLKIHSAEFHWIVPDNADTNVDPRKRCAYDRVVADRRLFGSFTRWGVADWFTDKRISNRWPVWAAFDTARTAAQAHVRHPLPLAFSLNHQRSIAVRTPL